LRSPAYELPAFFNTGDRKGLPYKFYGNSPINRNLTVLVKCMHRIYFQVSLLPVDIFFDYVLFHRKQWAA